jgi:RimJ/RimL family protein N-acetyltransferase
VDDLCEGNRIVLRERSLMKHKPRRLTMQYTISIDNQTGKKNVTTARTLLRGAELRDVDALNTCFSDAEVMRYW